MELENLPEDSMIGRHIGVYKLVREIGRGGMGAVYLADRIDGEFDVIIGNPPYGEFTGKYAGMGEKQHTGATEYDQYFIVRGLDVLEPGGLLVLLIPSTFMTNGSKYQKVKEKIAAKAELLDCYRLPGRIFETTDIGTDILVLKRK